MSGHPCLAHHILKWARTIYCWGAGFCVRYSHARRAALILALSGALYYYTILMRCWIYSCINQLSAFSPKSDSFGKAHLFGATAIPALFCLNTHFDYFVLHTPFQAQINRHLPLPFSPIYPRRTIAFATESWYNVNKTRSRDLTKENTYYEMQKLRI